MIGEIFGMRHIGWHQMSSRTIYRKRRKKMKLFGKTLKVGLMVFSALMMLSTVSFAGSGSPDSPPGAPPYGVKMEGAAKGTKLYGILSIAYSGNDTCNIPPYGEQPCTYGKMTLQLQRANGGTSTFYNEGWLPVDPGLQQDTLISIFKAQILTQFFDDDQSLNIVLVSMGPVQVVGPGGSDDYMVTDITLAVN
jgi:hypothetical protein